MRCSERRTRRIDPAPPETRSRTFYAEVPRAQIALYRFLLEGYDNLAVMSVVDRFRAVIRLRCTSHAEKTLQELLAAQGARIVELPPSAR